MGDSYNETSMNDQERRAEWVMEVVEGCDGVRRRLALLVEIGAELIFATQASAQTGKPSPPNDV